MQLVQFENGKFGVRTYWFFGWHFLDLNRPIYAWRQGSRFFHDCTGSRELAESRMENLVLKYQLIGPNKWNRNPPPKSQAS